MNNKIPTMLVLAAVTAITAATSAHALYAPGVSVVEVDMTRAVGIISTESGNTYAKVVGPGGSATYDITDPNNAAPMLDPVDGMTSIDWSPMNGVALASVGERAYAVVAAPGSPDGNTVEVCRLVTVTDIGAPDAPSSDVSVVPAPAPVAGHVELPEAEPVPAVAVTSLGAYTKGPHTLVATANVVNAGENATAVRLSSMSVEGAHPGANAVSLDMHGMTLTMLRDGEPVTYALTASDRATDARTAAYDVTAGGAAVGSVEFAGDLHAGTAVWPKETAAFRIVVDVQGDPDGPLDTVAYGAELALTVSVWGAGGWVADEVSTLVVHR